MALKGKEKEVKSFSKYVGLFNANVVAVNPTKDELGKLLNSTIEKEPEYMGSNNESGAKRLTVSFWLKEEQTGSLFNVRFNIEDTAVVSKSGLNQYINSIGTTSYAASPDNVPDFVKARPVRQAKKGEELLYKFLKNWLSNLNYEDDSTELMMDWKKLISGKVTELRDAIDSFKSQTVCALATVRTAEDGKEYQAVYSYEFLPNYALDCFNGRKNKNYKVVDKFIEKVTDPEYGCKDYYELVALKEYDPTKNVVGSSDSPVLNKSAVTVSEPVDMATVNDDLPF